MTCHCYREIPHLDATGRVELQMLTGGPWAGKRYSAHVYRDPRRIAGRKPYGGHVWGRAGRWNVKLPGTPSVYAFPTRAAAKDFIARADQWT